jgi:vitamin B12 transporter
MKFAGVIRTHLILFSILCVARAYSQVIHVDEILVSSKTSGAGQIGPVTILSEKDLAAKKSQTIADVLREVTGLDVAQSGGSGQPSSVFIRGAKSEHTLVLIDGIEANDSTTTTRFFDFSSLSVENIERIEVHRGASSVRFGADAVGGVINIITKKGSGPDRREISGEIGSYRSRRLSASNSGEMTHLNYSAALSLFSTDGFSAADAGPGDESDGLHRTTASMRLGWLFENSDDLSFTLRVSETATSLDASGGVAGDDPNYDSKSRQILSGITYQTKGFSPAVTSVFGAYVNLTNRKYLNLPDAVHATDYRENFQSENYKFETRQIYQTNDVSKFEALLQYRQEQGNSDQSYNNVASRLSSHDQSILGAALLYDSHLGDLSLAAGVRQDAISSVNESIFNSSISVSYDLENTGTSFQTGYGTGFKSPSLFQLYSNFGLPTLRSERAATFDFSIEQKLLGVAKITLSYFQNSYSDLIDFDIVASRYSNIATAKSDGAEIELAFSPVDDLLLKLAGKALRARDEATGLELLRRPRWSHTVQAEWHRDNWQSSLSYRFVGDRDDVDPVSFSRIRLPSHASADAAIHYTPSTAWKISLRLENFSAASYQDVAGYRSSGRAVYLSAARLWSQTD